MKKSNLHCLSLSSKTNLIMKRIVLILSLFVFACSGGDGDSNDSNDSNNNQNNTSDQIIGTWVLVNEEWVGNGTWPEGQCRGCLEEGDAGLPDQFVFTETTATKSVWECSQQDGSLCSELEVYGPDNWVYNGSDSYEIGGDDFPVTFNGMDEMQTPFEDGDILQTWSRVD